MRAGIRTQLWISMSGMIIFPLAMFALGGVQNPGSNPSINPAAIYASAFIIIAFFICAVLLTRLITSRILNPLKQLNAAAEQIRDGNLDAAIHYRSKDEMGQFCVVFDAMRVQLKEALEKHELDERLRTEMIACISHDLRTPMSSIKGYVEGLRDGVADNKEKYDRYVAVIADKTERLDQLIDELTQFSQLESGQLDIRPSYRKADEVLNDILHPMVIEFADLPVELLLQRPFPSAVISVDSKRLSQVFDNLINNAKRYAGDDGIIVIRAIEEDGTVKITVQDNGVGIDPIDLPHVFEHFYRGDKSRTSGGGGTGLGLAICKQIVEKHGGTIWVSSTPNKMTEFTFTLPIAENR